MMFGCVTSASGDAGKKGNATRSGAATAEVIRVIVKNKVMSLSFNIFPKKVIFP